jgi:hypothetical protein
VKSTVPVGLLPPVKVAVSVAEPPIVIDAGETEVEIVGEAFVLVSVKVQVTCAPTPTAIPETVGLLNDELPSLQLAVVKTQFAGMGDSETL